MRDTSDLASIGPKDDHKRRPAGVCNCCGVYYPPELRAVHEEEKRKRAINPFDTAIAILRAIGGLK